MSCERQKAIQKLNDSARNEMITKNDSSFRAFGKSL